jgi:hypothetical protein
MRRQERQSGLNSSSAGGGKYLAKPAQLIKAYLRKTMKSRKTLATDKKSDQELRGFLLDVVNAEDQLTDGTADYFFSRYPSFFPSKETDIKALLPFLGRRMTSPEGLLLEGRQILYRAIIGETREWLRAIWDAEDDYTKQWRLFNLQLHLHRVTDLNKYPGKGKNLQPPPLQVPMNQALRYLHRSFGRLKKCGNKDCKTPYFIADKGKQAYCSGECSAVAQKIYKRRWWKEEGPEWRAARHRKKKLNKSAQRKTPISHHNKPPA